MSLSDWVCKLRREKVCAHSETLGWMWGCVLIEVSMRTMWTVSYGPRTKARYFV